MRKSRQETEATRERIVKAAAAQFREHGIAGTALSDLMGAAGMTHGGFYKHFGSKEQVLQEATAFALTDRRQAFADYARAQPEGKQLAALVTAYLSLDHCGNPASGCVVAALGSEITRASDATRALTMEQFDAFVALIAELMSHDTPDRHGRAMAAASAMIGALTLARIAPGAAQAEQILASARTHILASWA